MDNKIIRDLIEVSFIPNDIKQIAIENINNEKIVSFFAQSRDRAYDVHSTILYSDKLSNKASVRGLNTLVENLASYSGSNIEIYSISLSDRTLSFYVSENKDALLGFIESMNAGFRK